MQPKTREATAHQVDRARTRRVLLVRILAIGLVPLLLTAFPRAVLFAEEPEPKSIRMTCGTCPSGYALTGVTTDPKICKDGDPTLVECVPIGSLNLLSVCGSCPEGYQQIGTSNVPARCGTAEGGRMSQCQLTNLEKQLPDPTKGGIFCPPNCAGQLPTPGAPETIPRPPKVPSVPEDKK
jgi:hypothetical protein